MNAVFSVDIDQCAHCGLVLGEDQFLLQYCDDCGFEYCREHADPEDHQCCTVCDETEGLDETEAALPE